MESKEPYTTSQPPTTELLLKRILFYSFATLMQVLRPIITKEIQIHDKEKTLENKMLTSGPCIWAFKHETTFDAANITSMWKKIYSLPDIKIIAKHFEGKEKIADYLISPFLLHVFRPSRGGWKTEEERKQMDEENRKTFETLKSNYLRGAHCVIFPEGTTDTDGTVIPIKAGCYNISFIKQDNLFLKIPIIPVGITYDRFAGGKHWLTKKIRYLAFINIGTPFTYEKAHDDTKQDIKHHTNRVRDTLIDCNTITTSQLAGEYVVRSATEGKTTVTHEQLQRTVAARVAELRKLEGLVFDTALLGDKTREKRVSTMYENIQDYFAKENELSLERVLLEPDIVGYKKKNPLRYSANRIIQLSEKRADISDILERTRI